ncbi:hypothetical protein NA57DRAFT_60907 [Rhizodiscina lignyota]|uniref:Uncharacterized protein n=1 Tax=Rhizodiscina lignyota TaxID=1504668 RepID=A0A9P4I9L1_9PEZI|nr:hypothetical protein NA57DRAFT_60907 [Rhizodiscina lignyota]
MDRHDLEAGDPLQPLLTENPVKTKTVGSATSTTNSPVATSEAAYRDELSPTSVAKSGIPDTVPEDGAFLEPVNLPAPMIQDPKEPAISKVSIQTTTRSGQAPEKPGGLPGAHASSNRDSHGIYWRSPALMGSGWAAGVIFSIGHHLFYSHFNGLIVGSTNEEQWNIRIGSLFALVVKTMLTSSVWFAYTQWLWRTLKRRAISLRGLDAAFSAEISIWSLLNHELILKVRMGAVLALIAWCLQIPPLITPATLLVIPSSNTIRNETNVLSLDIANATSANFFAYFIPLNDTGNFPNANNKQPEFRRATLNSYSTINGLGLTCFSAPYVHCTAANSTVERITDALLAKMNSTWEKSGLAFIEAYYAFVPSHDADMENMTTIFYEGKNYTALDQPRLQEQPMNATNELWTKYYRYSLDSNGNLRYDLNGKPVVVPNYSVCSLWNASYEVEFSFADGVQTVSNKGMKLLHPVDYPSSNPSEASDPVQMAYSALFMVLTDQVVGMMGIFINDRTSTPQYGSIDTEIEHNSLLGSNDLDYFFYLNSLVTKQNQTTYSPQRLSDKELAQNQTLSFLLQQLSFNATVSLMNDPLLASEVMANVTHTTPVNRYSYDVRNLWLAYGLGNFFALCAVALGVIAFISNDASHNNAVSTLLSIGRDRSLDPLFPPCCHGRLPLPEETMNAPLRVLKQDDGVENLIPPPGVKIEPSCRTCEARAAAAASPRSPNTERRRLSSFTRWTTGPKPSERKSSRLGSLDSV